MDNYPCMYIRCNEDAEYGIECLDGFGTTTCERHLEYIKKESYFKKAYRLGEE